MRASHRSRARRYGKRLHALRELEPLVAPDRHSEDAEKERLAQALRDDDMGTFTEAIRKVNRPAFRSEGEAP